MKAIKRTIASLLASLMLLSSVNVSFAAETYTDDEAVVVAKVNAAGIMTGTDNGFEPSKTLTRAEAAAIMVRMKGIPEAQVKSAAGTTLFGDVSASHWAAGYINVASSLGIIKGVGANEFAPDRTVTIAEMTTMAVRALGAGQLVDAQAGTWPTNYMNFAGEEKLTDGVFNVYTAEATRINAATIVANTLEADMWIKSEVTTNNEVKWEKEEGRTILTETLKYEVYEDITLTTDLKDREISFTKSGDPITLDVADGVDMTNLKSGIAYDVWYNADKKVKEVVGIWRSEDSKQKIVEFAGIEKVTTDEVTVSVDGVEKTYKIVTESGKESKLVANNSTVINLTKPSLTAAAAGNEESVFGTIVLDGSDIKTLYAECYEKAGIVKEITNSKIKFESVTESALSDATDFKTDDDDLIYMISKNGKEISLDDIKVGDAVFYYVDKSDSDIFHVVVSEAKVEGKVTSVSSTYIKLDGTKYEISDALTGIETGNEIAGYLNAAGKIVMYDEIELTNSSFAVIKEMQAIEDNKGKITAEITLVGLDGTEKEKMELDIEETAEELQGSDDADDQQTVLSTLFGIAYGTTNTDDWDTVEELNVYAYSSTPATNMLGSIVKYKEKGGKLVLTELVTTETSGSEDDKIDSFSASKVVMGTKKYIDNPKYYFTDSTVFMNVKTGTKDYKVKVEVVDAESMDNATSATGYVANINDDKEVKLVVFTNGLKREKEDAKYAIVLAKEELDDDEDYDYAYEVVYTDGTEESYFSDEELTEGVAYELTLSGDEITDKESPKYNGTTIVEDCFATIIDARYIKDEKNGILKTSKTPNGDFVLAENVIYIEKDSNGNYSVGKESKIEEFDTDNEEDATEIEKLIVRYDEDGIAEVIAIIYFKEDTQAYSIVNELIDADIDDDYDIDYKGNTITLTQKIAEDTGVVDSEETIEGYAFKVKTQGDTSTSKKAVLEYTVE